MDSTRRLGVVSLLLCILVLTASGQPGWKVSIVSVSSDPPEFVSGNNIPGRPGNAAWPGRPTGYEWKAVTVEVANPTKNAQVPASQVQLIFKDGNSPATAIAYRVKPKDSLVYLPLLLLSTPHSETGMKESGGSPKASGGWSTISTMSADRKRLEPAYVGFFEKMDPDKMLFSVVLNGPSGGREITIHKSPLALVFLFSVPVGASDLQVKFGDAAPVGVPAP